MLYTSHYPKRLSPVVLFSKKANRVEFFCQGLYSTLDSFKLSLPGFMQACRIVPKLPFVDTRYPAQGSFCENAAVVVYERCGINHKREFILTCNKGRCFNTQFHARILINLNCFCYITFYVIPRPDPFPCRCRVR